MIRIFTAATLAMLLIPAPAVAGPQEVIVTISNADLALSDRQFRRKVSTAVEEVCRSYAAVEPYQWPEIDECRKVAWTSVRQQLAELKAQQPVKLSER